MTRAFGVGGVLVLAFVAITWVALEWSGVVVVTTQRAEGGTRSTHVWYVTAEDGLWIEAGSPENTWYEDVQRTPHLLLTIDGRTSDYLAEPVPTHEAHERVRQALREKYGLRDGWVGLLVDTSHSVAVHLRPVAAPE